MSVSKALPITAKFVVEHGAWRLWVANPPGYVDVDARMIEREVNDFVYAQHRAGKIDAKTKAQLDRGAATRDVVDALEKRSDVFSSQAEWDAVPDLLRLRDGRILNVATGELREATPADLLSRSLGATLPSAEMSDTALRAAAAPLFDFAATGLDGDAAAVEWFLLTFPRYVIRGNRAKRTNAYVHSTQGNTGKSTAGHAYCALLGDYAEPLNVSDLDDKAHETWKLRLMGARFCYVDDMEQRSLASDFRRAVSGEVLKARPLYSNKAVSFQSQAAFLFTSNVRLRTSHRGTLSRLQIVPWSETAIADVDEAYRARLVAPEVLDAWLALILRHDADVRDIPARLRAAQDDYETESDTLIELARDAGCAEGDGEIEDTAFLAKLAEAQLVPRNVASPLRWVRALVREHPRVELVTRRARATEPRRYYVVGLVPLDGDAGGASDGAACSADMPF